MVRQRQRFRGRIAGVGTTSGIRVVVGRWHDSPLGSFGDAMVERADGHRVLVAPNQAVADFIAATYTFDEVRVEHMVITGETTWQVRSPSLMLDLEVGGRTLLGHLLRLVPRRVAEAPWWCAVTDLVARLVLRGVRTRGDTGDRREWYGATDHHRLRAASGSFDGAPLGSLRPVQPTHFGFSSTPSAPSVTTVVTTVGF
ncbi:MAG: hypothetical protein WB767_13165 [Nocardioides sp.]